MNINLPKDTNDSKKLITALNNIISATKGPNEKNPYVLKAEARETYLLLDEIRDCEKSKRFNNDTFYKPYVLNIKPLQDNKWIINISYIGVHENLAYTRMNVQLLAHKVKDSFLFSSLLLQNTRNWKVHKINNILFYFSTTLNTAKANEFAKKINGFDLKLKNTKAITKIYCSDDFSAALNLIGVSHKSDYNGRIEGVLQHSDNNTSLILLGSNISGFGIYDSHDLFHDRLGLLKERKKLYKPIDEGCAYLYGGSWGLSWKEIFTAFQEQVSINNEIKWTETKETPVYFYTKGFVNSADDIISALLVQKIEREIGFWGVWKLLNIGPAEKGHARFYQALEEITGITKSQYNTEIWKLIKKEK